MTIRLLQLNQIQKSCQKQSLLWIMLCFLTVSQLSAQKIALGGDWHTAANWSPMGVPTEDTYAVIPQGVSVTTAANAACGTLEVHGKLTTKNPLTLRDELIVSGSVTMGAEISVQYLQNSGVIKTYRMDGASTSVPLIIGTNSLGEIAFLQNDGIIGGYTGSDEDAIELQVHRNCTNFVLRGRGLCLISSFKMGAAATNGNISRNQRVTIDHSMEIHRSSPNAVCFSMQNGSHSGSRTCIFKKGRTIRVTGRSPFHTVNTNTIGGIPSEVQGNITYVIEEGAIVELETSPFHIYNTTANHNTFNEVPNIPTNGNNQKITFNIDGTLKISNDVQLVSMYPSNRVNINVSRTGNLIMGVKQVIDSLTNISCTQAVVPTKIPKLNIALNSGDFQYFETGTFNNHDQIGNFKVLIRHGSGYMPTMPNGKTYRAPLGFVSGACTRNPVGYATWDAATQTFVSYTIVDGGACKQLPDSAIVCAMGDRVSNWVNMGGGGHFNRRLRGATPVTFWMGSSDSTYAPLTIKNAGSSAASIARVNVRDHTWPTGAGMNGTKVINKTWWIDAPDGAFIGPTMDVAFGYNSAYANSGCNPTNAMQLFNYDNYAIESISSAVTPTAGKETNHIASFTGVRPVGMLTFMIGNSSALAPETEANMANNNNQTRKLNVYPTLTTGAFTIELPNTSAASVVICNLAGQVVLSKNNLNLIQSMDISNLMAGMYLVTITQNGERTTKRLVKQ